MTEDSLKTLVFPALIAAVGYLSKSIYEAILSVRKMKRSLLEEKLKNFYWPILTRLEQNSAIWVLILSKRNNNEQVNKSIAEYIEENIIMKNHREIVAIVTNYRYLAKFDDELSDSLKRYLRHVGIYEGILNSKQRIFPYDLGAPYPEEFNNIITKRTKELQVALDKKDHFNTSH